MVGFLLNFSSNSSLVDVISLYWTSITLYVSETLVLFYNNKSKSLIDTLPETLYFDEFQYSLLKIFTFILLTNLVLISVAWRVYGQRICERFMKPATNKAIEELKASVSKLKLPK